MARASASDRPRTTVSSISAAVISIGEERCTAMISSATTTSSATDASDSVVVSSLRASSIRSPTIRSSLMVSASTPARIAAASAARSPLESTASRSPTSSWARMLANGLRSSCEASETKRRSWSRLRCSRSSIVFIVVARRATSSCDGGTSTRWSSVDREIVSTVARSCSTGRSARPTSSQATSPTNNTSTGVPHHSARTRVATLSLTSSSGETATSTDCPSGRSTTRVTTWAPGGGTAIDE